MSKRLKWINASELYMTLLSCQKQMYIYKYGYNQYLRLNECFYKLLVG